MIVAHPATKVFTYSTIQERLIFYSERAPGAHPDKWLDGWLDGYWSYDAKTRPFMSHYVWEDFFNGEILEIDFEKRDVYL